MSSHHDVPLVTKRWGIYSVSELSFAEFLTGHWREMSHQLGFASSAVDRSVSELDAVLSPWGDQPIGSACAPPSFVSADGFPAEMSVSWKGGDAELRVLFESLGTEPTPRSRQEAGLALTHRLAETRGVSLDRFHAVADLFLADCPLPNRPTVWHSLAWQPPHPPTYKVYLNPQAHGPDRAIEVVTEAMRRLNMVAAWNPVLQRLPELSQRGHEMEFVGLDLDERARARVKVYFRHHPMRQSEMDLIAALAHRHDTERAKSAWRAIYGGGHDTTIDNEPLTCLAFRSGSSGPEEANLYLRLPDNARSDAEAHDRIAALMRSEGIDPIPYQKLIHSIAPAALETVSGLQELLSYRTIASHRHADLGVYLRFSTYQAPTCQTTTDPEDH
ncbi:tryptophan dimethylallyltransferase family protein [Saccharopolyspora sp. 5N708]|uniref:tryptophan dimethylallyltransferase family protein n=1 Tax=Saccharopolyspora sp. 5N708 TaxID=3457424 RepID=UPI003FD67CE4